MRNKGKGLGNNPLSEGIFTKAEGSRVSSQESRANQVSSQETQHSETLGQESQFLSRRQEDLRGTNVRLPNTLIDWVDELVRKGSRSKQKSRIPKEIWFQAALELFNSMPVDWGEIIDEEDLRNKLEELNSRINSQNY
ncbi:MAG: hypothetical protein MGF17_02775 [Trichodesmium sp. MAG_R04]|nr:hypothetical protein [Trichodesmium sp. MAG_R04]